MLPEFVKCHSVLITKAFSDISNNEIMTSCVKNTLVDRLFEEVINGNYPGYHVSRLNMECLQSFVVRLVEFTSIKAGAKLQSTSEIDRLRNWSVCTSDVLVHKSLNKDPKEFRHNLKKIVVDCCDFFRTTSPQWPPRSRPWINDENFDIVQAKIGKRKIRDSFTEVPLAKRRKTLLPFIKKEINAEPIVKLSRYIPGPTVTKEDLTKTEFLSFFKLGLNNNEAPKVQVPLHSRPNRLLNCPNIPFSSDIGKFLIKKENCAVPNHIHERKLEKLEWYLKNIPNVITLKYEVSYVPNKNSSDHIYTFPVRQYQQVFGNQQYQTFMRKLCKPLSVVVKKENLVNLRRVYNSFKVKIKVPRLSSRQLRHMCREARILIEKKKVSNKKVRVMIENRKQFRQPKIILVNKSITNNDKNQLCVSNTTAKSKGRCKKIKITKENR